MRCEFPDVDYVCYFILLQRLVANQQMHTRNKLVKENNGVKEKSNCQLLNR
jgi:hypothetical protein